MSADGLYIGLMSGTSVNAVDAVLVAWDGGRPRLLQAHSHAIPGELRERAFALARGQDESIHALCTLDRDIADLFADSALALLARAGLEPAAISAIGSHGQTLRHRPPAPGTTAYTLQVGDPNTIAERTGITTVADFRRRDLAAGGEAAPLVPPFHAELFGAPARRRAIVNIGGIANATILDGRRAVAGFDSGPGNTLLDAWIQRCRGLSMDRDGAWAAAHPVDEALLQALLADPWFHRRGPRSTGPELFNLRWLQSHLPPAMEAGRVQATLAELSARAIAVSLDDLPLDGVWVCGGGACNGDLMQRLRRLLADRECPLASTATLGIDPQWVEAAAFAWLARRRLQGLPGNVPAVTGARGERVLGGVFAGPASDAE